MIFTLVPENIHTPTTEGNGNSDGVRWGLVSLAAVFSIITQNGCEGDYVGGQRPRKFQRGGGWMIKITFQGVSFDLSTKIAT